MSDLKVSGALEVLNGLKIKGHLEVDKDTAGIARIKKGGERVEIKYEKAYEKKPVVVVTAKSVRIDFALEEESVAGFVIRLASPAEKDLEFSWIAVGGEENYELQIMNQEETKTEEDAQDTPASQSAEGGESPKVEEIEETLGEIKEATEAGNENATR